MPVPVLYPKVSLEMQTGRISRWLVDEGATVAVGDVLFEIENDKAAVEVESPANGVIRHLSPEGAEVDIGATVAQILAPDESLVAAAAHSAPESPAPPPFSAPVPASAVKGADRLPNPTPLARRIARERGLDLTGLTGTGPRGRVQKTDVMAHLEGLVARGARPSAAAATDTTGQTLNAVWLRRGTGMPVVLLHGFSGDLNNWRGLFAGARVDFPVLALDLPGHGTSPRAIPTDADALCALVEASIAAQVTGPLVLAGHSLGGAVAARIAARGGLDVRGLCLFAPAGLGPEIDAPFTHGILRARSAESLRPWLERLVYNPAVIGEAFVKTVAAQRQDEGLTESMANFAGRFLPDATQILSIRSDLAHLTLPVRVIFGRQDRILPFATTQDLPGTVAVHALGDCGHMPHLEHPVLSLRLLTELWRSAV